MEQAGNFCTVNGVPSLRGWTCNKSQAATTQNASNLKFGTNREAGPADWSGTYKAYGANPAHMPGEYVNLAMYLAPNAAGALASGEIWQGTALINSVAITWDWATNAPISYVASFSGHGDLTTVTGAPYDDTAAPTFLPPCGGFVQRVVTPTPVRVTRVKQAVLTITRDMVQSVNSGDTAGASKCVTMRYPGAKIDWTLALTRDEGNEDAAMLPKSVHELKLYVDNTNFWHLKYGIVGDMTGISVDRESSALISYTNNISMKAADAGTLGFIKRPGAGSNWWPT